MNSIKTCLVCLNRFEIRKIKTKASQTFRDEHGKLWYGGKCSKCYGQYRRYKNHEAGKTRPRDEIELKNFRKAVLAEEKVRSFFQTKGYHSTRTYGPGPDIVCESKNTKFTVEVKCAMGVREKKTNKVYWRISKIKKNREQDDYLAIVFENGFILIENMNERLNKGVMLTNDIRKHKIFDRPSAIEFTT